MFSENLFLILLLIASVTANRGPIGYELFRNIDRISELRTGVHTKQFSSFDRTGGNNDGGPYCLKTTAKGHCVIAEYSGSGEIDSIWMTRDNGVFNKTGHIVIELDKIIVVDNKLQDLLDGKMGPPFVWPLVGNGEDTSGGGVIKVPMPFVRSMRIIVDTNPNYFHVTYRTFSDSTDIKVFDPLDPAEDVLTLLRGFGVRDPKPVKQNTQTFRTNITKTNSENTIIFEQKNISAEIREIRIHFPDLVRSPRVIDDGRAFGRNGWSQFFAAIDPKNTGIRITRRLDPSVINQIARIYIDGSSAGFWNNTDHKANANVWTEETVLIDQKLTKNKTHINIRQEFMSSSFDFNEFRYEIDSLVGGQWVRTDTIEVGLDHPGEESAHRYQIFNQTWTNQRIFRYAIDARKLQTSDEFLAKTRIRATFDGSITVDAPIGQFFGSGLGMYDTRNLWFGVDARNAMFFTFWSMPFGNSAKIEIIFDKKSNINNKIISEVTFAVNHSIKGQLDSRRIGYFHATHREETTREGHDYVFVKQTGSGIFYGVSHTMRGLIKTGILRDYLEGDERVFIDGKQTPEIYGTGTEDFYESGWYFRNGITYDMPMNGNSGYETKGDDCLYDCTHAIRIYSGGISFESSLLFGIEHGPVDNQPAIYSSVAFWYGLPDVVLKQTDFVDVIDKTSRDKHSYKTEAEVNYKIKSSYEGKDYKDLKESMVTNTSKPISFKVSIDKSNKGIRLFRTSDQLIAYQCAQVYVDNRLIGQWLQPLGNQWSRFLDDSYDIPALITKGKAELDLKLVPVSYDGGPIAWSTIHYKIMSIL